MVVTRARAARVASGEDEVDVKLTPKTEPPAKRRKAAAPTKRPNRTVDAKIGSIYDYMAENGEDFSSTDVQYMLMAPLDVILGEGSAEDERCEDVKVLVDMVKDRIKASVERKGAIANEANDALTSAEDEEKEVIAVGRSASEKSLQQSNKISAFADTLQADREAELDAEEVLTKAQTEVEEFDASQAGMKEEVPTCEEAMKHFNQLKATDWGKKKEEKGATMWIKSKAKKEMTAHLEFLLDYLKELHAEDSLLQTAPHVFSQKEDDRGTFGKMALEKIDEKLNNRHKEIQDSLNNAELLKKDLISAASAAEKKMEEAKAKVAGSEKDLEKAEEDFMECKTEENEAKKVMIKHAAVVKRFKRERDAAKKEHQKAEQVMSHLIWLRDRKSTTSMDEPNEAGGEDGEDAE